MSDQPRLKKVRTLGFFTLLSIPCALFNILILTDAAFAEDRVNKYFSCKPGDYTAFDEETYYASDGREGRVAGGKCTATGKCYSQYDKLFVGTRGADIKRDEEALCGAGCGEFKIDYSKFRPDTNALYYKGTDSFGKDISISIGESGAFYQVAKDRFFDFGIVYIRTMGTCKIKYMKW